MAKHFLKTLTIFVGMLIVGLIGVYLVSHLDDKGNSANTANTGNSKAQIAK